MVKWSYEWRSMPLHDMLGEFSPQFVAFNDDNLVGQVWSREELLVAKIRATVMISGLISGGNLE
ncbi:hypothetical protein [Streptococcus castoreus]|uniref:hypothetical protein n=1 Tax=Streptococcus castoreus TaxID=254786 RepID=UPI0012EBBB95|nr:hypothetical protein [Streptococcus castoreus]